MSRKLKWTCFFGLHRAIIVEGIFFTQKGSREFIVLKQKHMLKCLDCGNFFFIKKKCTHKKGDKNEF
ncbi:MAG TPA: hypothetical protein DCE80_14325 [Ignavibacteriales bacterium]|nr:hypothetical protein [Ignavibacteriales bacterium]